jgi:hypothetical protein
MIREMKKGKEGKGDVNKSKDKGRLGKASGMKDFEVSRRGRGLRNVGVKDAEGKVRGSERGDE